MIFASATLYRMEHTIYVFVLCIITDGHGNRNDGQVLAVVGEKEQPGMDDRKNKQPSHGDTFMGDDESDTDSEGNTGNTERMRS